MSYLELERVVERCMPSPKGRSWYHGLSEEAANEVENTLTEISDFQPWARNPRIFILLYMVGASIEHIRTLPIDRLKDDYLPFSRKHLQRIRGINDEMIDQIIQKQILFLSPVSSMSSQEFLVGQRSSNRYIRSGDAHFLFEQHPLGPSATAYVTAATHKSSNRKFAAKRLPRGSNVEYHHRRYGWFKTERDVLLRLSHKHLVKCLGTFTDARYFTLILDPLAEQSLDSALISDNDDEEVKDTLCLGFGCLASAVAYLDHHRIRHKDIKPGNILINDGSVLLCDFGHALDWEGEDDSMITQGQSIGERTRTYMAPEVADRRPRGQSQDIWSLGCVFLEMANYINGHSVNALRQFIGESSVCEYYTHIPRVHSHIEEMRCRDEDTHKEPWGWTLNMLSEDPAERPRASDLVRKIQAHARGAKSHLKYIGQCCLTLAPLAPSGPAVLLDTSDDSVPDSPNPTSTYKIDREIPTSTGHEDHSLHPSSSSASGHDTSNCTSQVPDTPRSSHSASQAKELVQLQASACLLNDSPLSSENHTFDVRLLELHNETLWKSYRQIQIIKMGPRESPGINKQLCCSEWLPLHGVRVTDPDNGQLELHWSDCNSLVCHGTEDYETTWHRVFKLDETNRMLSITSVNHHALCKFRDFILNESLKAESQNQSICHSVDMTNGKVQIYGIPKQESNQVEYMLFNTITKSQPYTVSKLYMGWQGMDICFEHSSGGRSIEVKVNNLTQPDYVSNATNIRVEDEAPDGMFEFVQDKRADFTVAIPLVSNESLLLPAIRCLLRALTGCNLHFYEKVADVKETNRPSLLKLLRLSSTKEPADVFFLRHPRDVTRAWLLMRRTTRRPEKWLCGTFPNSSALGANGDHLANATLEIEHADTFGKIVAKLWSRPTHRVKQNMRIIFSSSEHRDKFFKEVRIHLSSLSSKDRIQSPVTSFESPGNGTVIAKTETTSTLVSKSTGQGER